MVWEKRKQRAKIKKVFIGSARWVKKYDCVDA